MTKRETLALVAGAPEPRARKPRRKRGRRGIAVPTAITVLAVGVNLLKDPGPIGNMLRRGRRRRDEE